MSVQRFIKVWIERRKNPPKKDGKQSVSYTLEWIEHGKRQFMSLGRKATYDFARQAAKDKQKELNSPEEFHEFDPITWQDFQKFYLANIYPGHDLKTAERKIAERNWPKSVASLRAERAVLASFNRVIKPKWCHEITTEARERFVTKRLEELPSAKSVESELRTLRLLFNKLEEWHHRRKGSNPFAGRGGASVGARRRRTQKGSEHPRHLTRPEIAALLIQADKETAANTQDWRCHRLRALIYFEAYTGCRIKEALHLEWTDLDLDGGIAWLRFKSEHALKTEGSEAPVGLSDVLIDVLRDWKTAATCNWVFPNKAGKPWTSGPSGKKPLDQLKALAKRAEIAHATWKMFRHSLNTHGKNWFGVSKEQMQVLLRHSSPETQKHYDQTDLQNLRHIARQVDYRKG